MQIKHTLLAFTSLGFAASTAFSTVIFYDAYDGTTGDPVTTYDSDYTLSHRSDLAPQTLSNNLTATGLTYAGFASSGEAVALSGANTSYQAATFSFWNNANDFTDFTTQQDLYFSFLVQVPETGTTGGFIGLQFQMGPAGNESSRTLRVGIRQNGTAWYLGGIRDSGTGLPSSGADVSGLIGQTILVAGRVAPIGTGWSNPTVSLYLNPVAGEALPGTASASFSGGNVSGGVNLTSASLFLVKKDGNNQSFSGIIDEVRFGTSWSDVTPVPEPATVGLFLGLGALGLVMWRRRRA